MIFWDLGLTLFDIPKDVVFAEILVLSNISGFLVEIGPKVYSFVTSWGPIGVPFESKFKILKDFSNTVFFLLKHYIWSKFQQDLNNIWGSKGPKPTNNGSFHK